jgi:hypothetical protein
MSINSVNQGILKTDSPADNMEGNQSGFYPFCMNTHINQRVHLQLKSESLYNISFSISEDTSISNSVLSFSCTIQQPANFENFKGYEIYFTKDLLNNESVNLAEKLKLFNSQQPVLFPINHNQAWRIKEIFESMLVESTKTDLYRNEMMKTLIHVLILFALRMANENSKSE